MLHQVVQALRERALLVRLVHNQAALGHQLDVVQAHLDLLDAALDLRVVILSEQHLPQVLEDNPIVYAEVLVLRTGLHLFLVHVPANQSSVRLVVPDSLVGCHGQFKVFKRLGHVKVNKTLDDLEGHVFGHAHERVGLEAVVDATGVEGVVVGRGL